MLQDSTMTGLYLEYELIRSRLGLGRQGGMPSSKAMDITRHHPGPNGFTFLELQNMFYLGRCTFVVVPVMI